MCGGVLQVWVDCQQCVCGLAGVQWVVQVRVDGRQNVCGVVGVFEVERVSVVQ